MNKIIVGLLLFVFLILPFNQVKAEDLPDYEIVDIQYDESLPASIYRDVTVNFKNSGYTYVPEEGSGMYIQSSYYVTVTRSDGKIKQSLWSNRGVNTNEIDSLVFKLPAGTYTVILDSLYQYEELDESNNTREFTIATGDNTEQNYKHDFGLTKLELTDDVSQNEVLHARAYYKNNSTETQYADYQIKYYWDDELIREISVNAYMYPGPGIEAFNNFYIPQQYVLAGSHILKAKLFVNGVDFNSNNNQISINVVVPGEPTEITPTPTPTPTQPESIVTSVSTRINIKNKTMHQRLKGKIILKVEDAGKAYYVHPSTQEMYYLGRPDDAFSVMREQGVGITSSNLEKIPIGLDNISGPDSDGDGLSDLFEDAIGTDKNNPDTDGDGYNDKQELEGNYDPNKAGGVKLEIDNGFSEKQKGKIMLQVENNGEAWYVSPEEGKRYFLGRPADAFAVMRNLGLGISNENFNSL